MSKQIEKYSQKEIAHRIYSIRGVQVMLDKDLAAFYEIKPIRLREQVKRNPNRFPSDFVFQLNDNEVDFMVSQNAIPSKQSLGGYLPYAFTEQGVAAASGVIKSDRADEMSVAIARAFVQMRKFIANNAELFQRLDSMEQRQLQFQIETNERFEKIFNALEAKNSAPQQGVFFNGQIYDAYSFTASLIREATVSIILIDNYVDDSILTLLSKRGKNVSATIYTKTISKQLTLDLKKHNSQYPEVNVVEFKEAHDRFLILDEKELYHLGASLKDLGKKWFAFSKMDNMVYDVIRKLKQGGNGTYNRLFFSGKMLIPGFSIYLFELIHDKKKRYYYLGMTGDNYYPSARSAIHRLSGHFERAKASTQNQLKIKLDNSGEIDLNKLEVKMHHWSIDGFEKWNGVELKHFNKSHTQSSEYKKYKEKQSKVLKLEKALIYFLKEVHKVQVINRTKEQKNEEILNEYRDIKVAVTKIIQGEDYELVERDRTMRSSRSPNGPIWQPTKE